MTIDLSEYLVFLLIMLRMTGMLVFHPILGRSNIPNMANAGLAFVLAILLLGSAGSPQLGEPTLISFFLLALKELSVGFIAGFVLRMFLSIIVMGGEVIDMQLGISMSKVFDPATNASIALTASLYNILFILAFFFTNNHLTFLQMAAQTLQVIPLGFNGFNPDNLYYVVDLFSSILLFTIKLTMPVVVVEMVVSMAVGIIMRIIPQINVFVVNIQFKLLIGIFILVVLVVPVTGYFENLLEICFDNIRTVWAGYLLAE